MIKTLNSEVPGVKRPLRISDLQDIWDGLGNALASTAPNSTTPIVLSGFYAKTDNTLSAGAVAYGGKIYYHPDTDGYRITVGSTVYVKVVASGDTRTFDDGSVRPMSTINVCTSTGSSGDTVIGAMTLQNISLWRLADIDDGSIPSSKIADGAVVTAKIATGAVTETRLADSSVSTAKIQSGAVVNGSLATGSVDARVLADQSVTASKLSGTLGSGAIADGSVTTSKIVDRNVTTAKIATGAVTSNELAAGSVITSKIADNAITADKIAGGEITNILLASSAVDTRALADRSVTSVKIATGAVTVNELGNSSVTAAKILNGSVSELKIADGAVTATKIANAAVGAMHLAPLVVGTTALATNAVSTDKIAGGAVTSPKIANSAVGAAQLNYSPFILLISVERSSSGFSVIETRSVLAATKRQITVTGTTVSSTAIDIQIGDANTYLASAGMYIRAVAADNCDVTNTLITAGLPKVRLNINALSPVPFTYFIIVHGYQA